MASVVRIVPKSTAGVTSANRVTADYLHSPLVINSTGKTLAPGTIVYAQSSDCGCFCEIYPADASVPTKANPFGVVVETVFTGKTTRVAVGGTTTLRLTPGLAMPDNGSIVYLSSEVEGTCTPTAPDALNNSVVEVGKVTAGMLVVGITSIVSGGVDLPDPNQGGGDFGIDLPDLGDLG